MHAELYSSQYAVINSEVLVCKIDTLANMYSQMKCKCLEVGCFCAHVVGKMSHIYIHRLFLAALMHGFCYVILSGIYIAYCRALQFTEKTRRWWVD